ncbi:hypothetical protein LSAT2_027831 [Lamellibrachia satsuma]|nr:hypothetical protein LSAT2_027831 [Lamellibrachia satsuma]
MIRTGCSSSCGAISPRKVGCHGSPLTYVHLVVLFVLLWTAPQRQSSAGLRAQPCLRLPTDAYIRRHRRLDLEHRLGNEFRATLACVTGIKTKTRYSIFRSPAE